MNPHTAIGRGNQIHEHIVELGGGQTTYVYTAVYPRDVHYAAFEIFDSPTNLVQWTASSGISDAINGGFTIQHRENIPTQHLGIHRSNGRQFETIPFGTPKSGIHISPDMEVNIVHADDIEHYADGDFLQAGPMIVRDGQIVDNFEGVGDQPLQFDDDISVGRFPRAAIGLKKDSIVTVSCDGYTPEDDTDGSKGLSLVELGQYMMSLGITDALNLDGGSKVAHIARGKLINHPRGGRRDGFRHFPSGREVMSAITIRPKEFDSK